MLDIKELRKYLEEATSDEYIYNENEYIIHYDTEREKNSNRRRNKFNHK